MPFTIPDQGEGDSNLQSIWWQEEVEVLLAGINGVDCVLSGLVVTGGADMTPAVAKGAVLSNKVMFAVAAADVTITTADATNPRLDLIVVNSSGTLAVRAGTPAAFVEGTSAPKPPARTANDVVIAIVYVPANDTAIATTQIIDKRVLRENGPICVYRTTTAEVTNNTSAAVEILDKTNSGVVIPNGLFLAGRILRVRIWGNRLVNSGTPTETLAILYGATTMFADTSAAAVADADRKPFTYDFMLVAQGNADQALTGFLAYIDNVTALTAPTTGIGDAWPGAATQEATPSIGGSAAENSDTGNRTLNVRWTCSVANAANEIVVEGAIVELI